MAAAIYDINLEQGVPLSKTIYLQNPDDSIKDLTGFTAKMQLRQYVTHSDVLLELSTTNSKININVPSGSVTMAFSEADTRSLTFTNMDYDLFLYNGSNTFKALSGKVYLKESVTV